MRKIAYREVIEAMTTYRCMICGHVYSPAAGEPAQGIAPGIELPSLPGTWQCPVCLASKDKFKAQEG
jgi:rubredoxin